MSTVFPVGYAYVYIKITSHKTRNNNNNNNIRIIITYARTRFVRARVYNRPGAWVRRLQESMIFTLFIFFFLYIYKRRWVVALIREQ